MMLLTLLALIFGIPLCLFIGYRIGVYLEHNSEENPTNGK